MLLNIHAPCAQDILDHLHESRAQTIKKLVQVPLILWMDALQKSFDRLSLPEYLNVGRSLSEQTPSDHLLAMHDLIVKDAPYSMNG